MKIKNLKFTDHPILGNLELDFTNDNGNVVDTIIIAGENGAGKSVLLNELYDLFNSRSSFINGKTQYLIDIEVLFSVNDRTYLEQQLPTWNQSKIDWDIESAQCHYNVFSKDHDAGPVISDIYTRKKGNKERNRIIGYSVLELFRQCLKRTFSDVGIDYGHVYINSVTAKNVDDYILHERSDNNMSEDILQLLIDIKALDDSDLSIWVRDNKGSAPPDYVIDKRIKRFTNAFDYIFTNKKFKSVVNNSNSKDIFFEETGKTMSISVLSSGEKQIVYRGSYLLKNKESIKGAMVLIDEPEISLHPTWQLKILDYYKKLFQEDDGIQTSQLFVVTHSPFIIHNTNRSNDKVIILKKNADGNIEVSNTQEFYGWTTNKIIQEAFNIDMFTDDSPSVFLEGEIDEKYIKRAIDIFKIQTNVNFKWIGKNNNGKVEFTGDTALNHTKSFLSANAAIIKNKIVLLYDSDTNKPEETDGNILIRTMPKANANEIYKIGIESLLKLPSGFDKNVFYSQKTKTDNYSAISTITELDKSKLCDWICKQDDATLEKALSNIKYVIEKIISEL